MGRLLPLVLALAACANASHDGDNPDGSRPIDVQIDSNGCPVQPCTILPQCGCIGLSACDLDAVAAAGTACRTIATQGHETASCDSLDDCDRGYVCLGNSAYASCKKYCMVDADCGTPRGRCALDIRSGGQVVPGIPPACSSNCDPMSLNPPECPSTFKCSLFSTTHNNMQMTISDCALAGGGAQGADCKSGTTGDDTRCAKGYSCTTTDNGTTFRCRRWCTQPGTTQSAQCGNQACIAFTTPLTLAGVSYGVCAP